MRKISMILALCLCLAMLMSAALADGYTFPLENTETFTALTNYPVGTESDPNNRTIFKRLEEATNVHVEWRTIQSDQWGDKISLEMSNPKTLPELVFNAGFDNNDLLKYAKQGAIIPLEDYIDTCMMKRYDVVALGELLIDFTESGMSGQGNPVFEANPGGAPCNVLAMLRKLDKKCAFVGKVGEDMFGHQLKAVTEEAGIDMSALCMDANVRTTLAFVKTDEHGDRDFSFYRNPGADMRLTEDELPLDMLSDTKIFHFGTLSMTHDIVRQATKAAVMAAKEAGAIISFDPNLRPPLWGSLNDAKAQMAWGLGKADVVKIADNEIEFMTGTTDYERGATKLRECFPNIRLLNVTAGANGSYAFFEDKKMFVPSFLLGKTIETTGAGDTFCASVLNFVLERGLEGLGRDDLKAMLRFANAAAYLVTTKKGAIKSMPERAQVEAILREH